MAPVSVESKARELADVMSLCKPTRAVSDMASTYDRRGGNMDWWTFPAPFDGKELYEVVNLKGPGCLTRIWMTNVNATEWLFFFDGEAEARICLTPDELFGNDLPWSPLVGKFSGAAYSYLPLPYEKSLRVAIRVPKRNPQTDRHLHPP